MNSLQGSRPCATVLATLAITALMTSCDSQSQSPQLAHGWVTTCAGPVFSAVTGSGSPIAGTGQPVFRVNDQLVLAVPKVNGPSANRIESEPHECRQISDLPLAHFLYFVISGNWSAGYQPADVPVVGGNKEFMPDVVTVRIEPQVPSTLSEEDQRKIDQMTADSSQQNYIGTREIGGLTCLVPKPAITFFSCSSSRPGTGAGVVRLRYRDYANTPFVLLQAGYLSPRYGGIQVYWTAWTLDVSHALEIDAAIWKSIEAWNLLNKKEN